MADQFDSLMGGGVGALAGLSAFFGGVRRENEALRQRGEAQQLNSLQLMSEQRLAERQTRFAESALAAQQSQQERQFQLQREESAYDRLNQSLEMQLKFADREAARRDKAFENSMRAEQFRLQTRVQGLQLQQLERQVEAQDLAGAITQYSSKMQAGGYSDLGQYADDLRSAMAQYKGGTAFYASTEEGQEMLKAWNSQIRAAQLTTVDVPMLSPDLLGQKPDRGTIERIIQTLDLSKPMDDNQRQAFALMVEEAERNITPEQLAELGLGDNLSPTEVAREKVRIYAETKKGNPHWDNIANGLKAPLAEARFEDMHRSGLLTPIRDERTMERLNMLAQSEMMELAEMIRLTNGRYLVAPEFEQAREEFEDGIQYQRANVIAGRNPNAVKSLQGGLSFDTIHRKVMDQADRSRTASDLFEATGIPGSFRAIRDFVTGQEVSGADIRDLGLTALMFVPGFGWAARGALGAGKFVLGTGARLAGRGAALRAGGREALAQGFAQTRAALGARAATRTLSAQAAPGATAFTPAALREAAKQTTGRALEGTRSLPELLKLYSDTSNKARNAATWAARRNAEKKLPALQRAISDASAASVQELNIANAAARATAAARLPGAQAAFRQAIPGAAREAIGAAALATRTGMFFTTKDFNELTEAKTRVEENILGFDALGRKASPAAITELQNNIRNYINVAGKYFPDGQIPAYLQQTMFDLKGIVPPTIARAIQREVNMQNAMATGTSGFFTNADIRNFYATQRAASAAVAPGIQNMTQGGFNLLAQPSESE